MTGHVICIGAVLVDELFYCSEPVISGTSNPALMKKAAGGVMCNIATHLALLDIPVQFITILGNDADAGWLRENCEGYGIDMRQAFVADVSTGKYSAILNPDGSLHAAACFNPAEKLLTPDFLAQRKTVLQTAAMIVADTNLAVTSLQWLNDFCKENDIPLLVETVSVAKARKISALRADGIFMITPNEDELYSIAGHEKPVKIILDKGIQMVWLRKGEKGSSIINQQEEISLPAAAVSVKDITGAGDAALSGWIAGYYYGFSSLDCLKAGHAMAAEVIQVESAIAHHINKEYLLSAIKKYYPDEQ